MVLHREDRQRAVAQPFDRAIVEIDVRHSQLGSPVDTLNGAGHGEPMILGRDQDLPRGQVLHWLIPATMPEGHFLGPTAKRQAD
jgi:hypothetical protein